MFPQSIEELATSIVIDFTMAKATIATAESCTGGMVASAITDIAGSSAVINGGIISYTNQVKNSVLGVSQDTLDTYGAVSSQTACEMAQGARKLFKSTFAVSTTGIAGPSGAEPGKPVGTVWFGLASDSGVTTYLREFSGDRGNVRTQATAFALELLKQSLADA